MIYIVIRLQLYPCLENPSESSTEIKYLLFTHFYKFSPLECPFIMISLIWANLKMLSAANKSASLSAPFNLA